MAGYYGHSMSNNAMYAYSEGLRPISKWNKKDLIESALDADGCAFSREELQRCTFAALKKFLLENKEWHHTSKHFNETDFWGIDEDRVSNRKTLTKMRSFKQPKKQAPTVTHLAKIRFEEWVGTRNNGAYMEKQCLAIIKGKWAYTLAGKKHTTAKHFLGAYKYKVAPSGTEEEFAQIAKKHNLQGGNNVR